MAPLRYRSFVGVEDLALGECTIHRATASSGARYWNFWWYAARETDGAPEAFCVPVVPRAPYTEGGPGGRSWGLNPSGPGTWQVSPSIDVYDDGDARRVRAGLPRHESSLWHQTPAVAFVPDGEPWASGGAP